MIDVLIDDVSSSQLRGIKPVRWTETRRRIEAIEAFLSTRERTNAALAQFGQTIGLSGGQFRRLVRSWEFHKDALLIQPRGTSSQRERTDGLAPKAKEIMANVISDLGCHSDLREVSAEIVRRCELEDITGPSDQYAWKALMFSRRLDRKLAERVQFCTLIGRIWFDIPVTESANSPICRPEVVVALVLPSKAILAHRSDIAIGRKPKVDDILAYVPSDGSLRMTSLEAGRLARSPSRARLSLYDGVQADMARYLGCAIGNLPVRSRRPSSDASSLLVSKFDRPLSRQDALLAMDMAFAIHAEEINSSGSKLGGLF
jgi:hypothetical protein